ncbi:SH3 domain-containing protein [Sorangium sp. So ce375]|uniref:SH3 domain-containing protein n=1 Tax=Sorangium sp. So ce375 TaxID=3133306 RepID=UPI003F5BC3A9
MDDSPAGQGASPGARDVRAAHAGPRLAARAEPPPGDAPAPPRARRLDRLTGLVLFAAATVVLLPTAPVVLRAVAGDRPPVQGAGRFAHLLEERSPAGGRAQARPRFRFDEEEGDDERQSPHEDGPAFDDEEDPRAPAPIQAGIASRSITLLDEPRADGARVGAVAAGEVVMIVREWGEWAHVLKSDGGTMLMGWARRSEIAIR